VKVVLDANVLVSALMRDGFTRTLLVHPDLKLVTPEYALAEVLRHLPSLAKRMPVPIQQARLTLELLLGHVTTAPHEDYGGEMRRAEEILRDIDPDDAPFAALALAAELPLWTQDNALLACADLPTITMHDLARRLGVGAD
jgi:predicted nucleic acid-binding protein